MSAGFGYGLVEWKTRGAGAECGVRSAECGVRSAEVRSAECGVRSAECGVRSAECGVRSAENEEHGTCGVLKMRSKLEYSGTPLLRKSKGHDQVSALSGCPY